MRPNLLAAYLACRGLTQEQLAADSGVPQSCISRIVSGGDARGRLWARLAAATGGEVTAERHWAAEAKRRKGKAA